MKIKYKFYYDKNVFILFGIFQSYIYDGEQLVAITTGYIMERCYKFIFRDLYNGMDKEIV